MCVCVCVCVAFRIGAFRKSCTQQFFSLTDFCVPLIESYMYRRIESNISENCIEIHIT